MSTHYEALVGMNYVPVGSHKPIRVEEGEPARRLPARAVKGLLKDGAIRVTPAPNTTPATEGE